MNSSVGFVLICLLLICVSIYKLLTAESEARHLIEQRKAWGYTHDNDEIMLRKSKRGVIFLYTTILIGCLIMLSRFVVKYISTGVN
jgi:Na+-transporting methylmalonyl-CoA/oxaloacetate decarboxylase gamma subunit